MTSLPSKMDPDSESIVLNYHEHYPKDALHEELLSLRDPWILADRVMTWCREQPCDMFGMPLRDSVFDGLDRRMLWPKSDRYLIWKASQDRHYAKWGQVQSAVGGRFKNRTR